MEKKVNFYDNIDDDPQDFRDLQNHVEESLDHIVADAITRSTRYTGFNISKSSPTAITIAAGRLYSSGKVYGSGDNDIIKEYVTKLPLIGKVIGLVLSWGTEQDTDSKPRQFLINAETRQAEPQTKTMTHQRLANIDFTLGTASADPTAPIPGAGYTVVGGFTLSPTGVDSVWNATDTALTSIESLEGRVVELETFEKTAGYQIKTLTSDIAGLKAGQTSGVTPEVYSRTLMRVAVLESKAGVSSAAIDSDANYFLDTKKSKLDDILSRVKVEEGIRFPDAAAASTALVVFNPLDPFQMTKGGVLFPAYDRESWLQTGTTISQEEQVAAYTQTTQTMVQKMMSRQRVRYGDYFDVCTNSAFWNSGSFDPLTGIFTMTGTGEKFAAALDLNGKPYFYDGDGFMHVPVRLAKIWYDTVQDPYWDQVVTSITVNGSQVAETWLQGQDMWLDAVGLWFTRLAATGSVHVAICEVTKQGLPDLTAIVASTTVDRANLVAGAETVVALQPTYLQAGKRYATLLTTAADHYVGMVSGTSFPQGTYFKVLDGAYAQGDASKDMWMRLYRAKFRQARTVVTLNGLSLSGGILKIDILAGGITPGGCSMTYEVQVNGKWYNFNDVDVFTLGQGGTIPPLLPLRAVFMGSADIMPCINLLDSMVTVSRPDTSLRHISQTRTLPAASSKVRVIQRYEFFEPAVHAASLNLRTGADFSTVVSPNSISTKIDPVDGAYERTYLFNLGAAITQFRKDTQNSTQTAQNVFHVAWEKDWAE